MLIELKEEVMWLFSDRYLDSLVLGLEFAALISLGLDMGSKDSSMEAQVQPYKIFE